MGPDDIISEALPAALALLAGKLARRLRLAARGDRNATHAARTALRRLQEGLAILGRSGFEAPEVGSLAKRLRHLEKALGPVRDADVLLRSLDRWIARAPVEVRAGIAPLRKHMSKRRRKHLHRLGNTLRRPRAARTTRDLRRLLRRSERAASSCEPRSKRAERSLVRHVVAEETWRAYDEIRAYETRLGDVDSPTIHKVRSACRRMRHRLELFDGALPPQAAKVVDTLRGLQQRLGELHDRVVALDAVARWLGTGAVQGSSAVDRYVRSLGPAHERLRAEFDAAWPLLTGASFSGAVAEVASSAALAGGEPRPR